MKKVIVAVVLAKVSILIIFAALFFSTNPSAESSSLEISPTPLAKQLPIPNENINRPVSEPYTGDLSIFEDEKRAENLQIDRVMDILKITDGKSVADIGAGSGWFTVRAAKRVGDKGKVFAVEINEEYITHLKERAKKENYKNIKTVRGAEDNPNLAKNSVDAVLILKTYHEIAEPIKVLKNLKQSLKPNALIGIIDKNGAGDDHGISKETIIDEAKRAGFSLVDEYDFVKPDGMDYFLVFRA